MDHGLSTRADRRNFNRLAKLLVEVCVRSTDLEDLHVGNFQASETSDYSEVKVISPFGEATGITAAGLMGG